MPTATQSHMSSSRGASTPPRRSVPTRAIVLVAVLIPLAAVIAIGVIVVTAQPSLAASGSEIATIKLPFGSGTVDRVTAIGDASSRSSRSRCTATRSFPRRSCRKVST